MAIKVQRPKGTADVLPSQSARWQFTEELLRETARTFGYRESRFPSFEHTELFVRSVGDTTDVVQKEMYTFEDKGGRSITLRPEGTASMVRSFIENGENQSGFPYKAYYIASVFRYEKPQAGRFREHHQFGCECFGSSDAAADAELIGLARSFMNKLSIDTELHINSIGCPKCRPNYNRALKDYLSSRQDELCPTCQDRLTRNPLRVLDCKDPDCKKVVKDAPHTTDYLCDECRDHFEKLKELLDLTGISYTVDSNLVRGLDYYTKTVFEFISTGIGAQGTVCGGGRYDDLIEQMGGASTPAVGFGCGLERLMSAAEQSGFTFPDSEKCTLFLVSADAEGEKMTVKLCSQLRADGFFVEKDLCGRGVRAQMKHADRIGARFTAVCGSSEAENNVITVKNMKSGQQKETAATAEAIMQAVKELED